jgi:hypothetical protein
MREHAASDKPVAAAISLSENASSFGGDLALEPCLVSLARMLARRSRRRCAVALLVFACAFRR